MRRRASVLRPVRVRTASSSVGAAVFAFGSESHRTSRRGACRQAAPASASGGNSQVRVPSNPPRLARARHSKIGLIVLSQSHHNHRIEQRRGGKI